MFRLQNIPLRVVLVVPFVLEVMVAVGLTAFLVHQHGQDATNDLANRLMLEISDRTENQLESYLEIPVQVTLDHARAIQHNIIDWRNPKRIEDYFWHRLQSSNHTNYPLNSLLLVDQQQQLIAVENVTPTDGLVYRRNRTTQGQLRGYLIEPERGQFHYEIQFNANQDPLREKVWYQAAKQSHLGLWQLQLMPKVSSTLSSERSGLVIAYIQSFRDATLGQRGVLWAAIDLEQISQVLHQSLQPLTASHQGQAFIVDPTGALVASSTKETLMVPRQGSEPMNSDLANSAVDAQPMERSRLQAVRSLNSTTQESAKFLANRLSGANAITRKSHFRFEAAGKQYFLQVTPLQNPKHLNWFLVVALPKADFAVPVHRQYHTILALSSIALLGAITLGLLTAQQITRPILRLSRASRDLMLGKLDVPVEEHSRIAELAIMAHSFNEMTEQVMQSFDQVKLALQESKEKFTTVFRTSPDPILVSTLPEGKILEVNDSFLRLMGYSREQVIEHTVPELGLWIRPADREEFLQAIEEIGKIYNHEVSTITQYGTTVTALISSEVIELDGTLCLLTVCKDITERKRLEDALQQSEAKLHDVLNSVAAAICYFHIDETGALQPNYFSAGAQVVFGYSPAVLMVDAQIWQSHVHPEDWKTVIEPCFAAVAQGRSQSIEYRYYYPGGNLRWISADVMTRWDDRQQRWSVTSVEFDITDRKWAEENLRNSEERFRTAFDTAAIGMDIAAPDGQLIRVNKALCQMLGYAEAELLERTYRDITHPDDLANDHVANGQILSGEVPSVTFEKRFIHKDGQTVWTFLSLALVRDVQQQPLYWVAQIQNITARKHAEECLQQSEARFRAVFETASLGIAIADLEGNIAEVNDTFCRICGHFKADLQQMKLQTLIHPGDLQRWLKLLEELPQQWLDHYQMKLCCIRKDGQFTWVQFTTLLIRDSQRHPLYLVVRMEVLPTTSFHQENKGNFSSWSQ
ncbi:MAG: PAS domain S-box protein [Leptolyngbyaceae cyanobacterium bins.349]|nr:PAS domain S-box protein [Leptolyngbyaceae cyanobacterium bins.349]